MINRLIKPRTELGASKLNWAIPMSFAAMLGMNIFVLSQQLTAAPTFAVANGAASAQQA